MRYNLAIAFLPILIETTNTKGTYECTYMLMNEEITQDEITEEEMDLCRAENECTCVRIATKCTFGPDHKGEFTFD